MLSYTITDELTKKLKIISELCAEKAAFIDSLSEDHKNVMKKYAIISTIGGSTRIENAVLTNTEIAWMDETLSKDQKPTAFNQEKEYIKNKLSRDRERSIEEVVGCRSMLAIVYVQAEELFPLTETTIKGLHNELLHYYSQAYPYLGKYKIVSNSVVEIITGTSIQKDVLKTADPGPITDSAMQELVSWYNKALHVYSWPIAVATEFVFRFLAIHPFQDGNGRLGRALFILALLQSQDKNLAKILPYISIDRHIEKHREEYYLVLRRCSSGKFSQDPKSYRIEYFLNFMLKRFEDALNNDIEFYARRYSSYRELADSPQKVLLCFKEYPEKRLQLKDVMALTHIPRRTVIYSIQVLVTEGFLQKEGKGPATKYQLTF